MVGFVEGLGWNVTRFVGDLGGMAVFTAQIVRAVVRPPTRGRLFVRSLFDVGVLSLIIICVCGTAVGMVLGLQGFKVGQVTTIALDPKSGRARVTLDLDERLEIPVDTTASIMTSGILGDRYVLLQLGGDPTVLKPGEEISFTESAVLLERLIGKLIHNSDVKTE